jgi:acetyl coenzyme A synthetase (ADP forming)-like protein
VPELVPVVPALPVADDVDSPRLLLRDGSVAAVRIATSADRKAVRRFFHDLSPESRRRRFFTAGEPPDAVVDRMCDGSNTARTLSLLVERQLGADVRPVAIASYLATTDKVAEVAFAVDDQFQGKGLGTALLERLAVLGARHGLERFQATTLADNVAMLEVFRDSGFVIRSKTAAGCVDVELSLTPSADAVRSAEERQRLATAASLVPLLTPKSVAVVGASRDPASIGRRIFDAIRRDGFTGPVYPINPHATTLDGVTCYASVRDLPCGVDLAVVAVPRDAVLAAVDDCAVAGIRSLVVVTAGFAEAGAAGQVLQQQLVERVRAYGMRMIGPNCMGVLNALPAVSLNASFSPVFPPSGRIGLSSQSGALGLTILELAAARHVGLSTFVSVGNKADVSGNDLLQYWEGDPATSVILLYLESFGNPRRFARLARRIARTKPIVAVKAGRTRAGVRAAGSHTAALAASDAAVDAMFQQTGVIRASTIDEMFDIAACLDTQPLPNGRRVAIVTNAGGPGILAVDACEAAGLDVVEFSPATRDRLEAFLPHEASVANPVDMVASAGPGEYERAVEIALTAPDTDALIVIFTPIDRRTSDLVVAAIRRGIANGRRAGGTNKPILACVMAEPGRQAPLDADGERIPSYAFPENAARALGRVASYASWRAQPPGLCWGFEDIHADEARSLCQLIVERRGDDWLTPEEMHRVLSAFNVPLVPSVLAHGADEAVSLAAVFGYPVAAKLQAHHILHKSDIGGVRVGLTSDRAVRTAFRELMELAQEQSATGSMEGVVIQPMVAGGVETMIGITDDPLFGPLVAFGLGGVHVEVLGDVRFKVAPLTDRDADDLLRDVRGFRLLEGYRGHPPADVEALRELLLRVARLAEEVPEIVELDLNPVIALPPGHGYRIVDARIRVGRRRHV